MILNQQFLKKLRSAFNLNEYEVKIWTALLSKGSASAGELSDIGNVPRSRAYDILESLEKKGFIIMKLDKPIKYLAVEPKEIINRVKKDVQEKANQQIDMVSELQGTDIFNDLSNLFTQGIENVDPTTITSSIKGRKNIYNQIETMLRSAEKSVVISTTKEGFERKFENFKFLFRKLKDKGVKVKVIIPEDIQDKDAKNILQTKILPEVNSRFILVDNKELMFMLTDTSVEDKSDVAIWVTSPYFVNAMDSMINLTLK
jgi:HTH-type transcriptional regulator, sugar sensing transcriptional regulator